MKKLIRNGFYIIGGEFGSRIFAVLGFAFLARGLGQSDVGKVGLSLSVLNYLLVIMTGGLNTYGIREISRDGINRKSTIYQIVILKALLAVPLYLGMMLIMWHLPKMNAVSPLMLAFGASVFASVFDLEWYFKGTEKMAFVGVGSVSKWLFLFIAIVGVVKRSEQLIYIGAAFSLGYFISSIGMFAYGIYLERQSYWELHLTRFREIIVQSAPMLISSMLVGLYVCFDRITLQIYYGSSSVGLYDSSFRVSQLLRVLATAVMTVFFPRLSKYFHNKESLQDISTKYVRTMFVLAFPLSVFCMIFSADILRLVFGPGYAVASSILKIHLVAGLIAFGTGSFGSPLNAWERQKTLTACILTGSVANVILNFILVPFFGMTGAAIASVFGEATILLLSYMAFRKVVRVPVLTVIYKPLLASLVMGAALYLMRMIGVNFFLAIPLGAFVYIFIIVIIGGVTIRELQVAFQPSA